LHAETRGDLEIAMGDETFTLTGVADRIEIEAGGAARFLDYKTGRAPTDSQVRSGLAPQLTLEAAIWRHGRFGNIAASGAVAGASYVQLRGGDPAGEECKIEFKNQTAEQCADTAFARLSEIVRRFANPDEPYRSLVHPLWANRYGPYDHLARVKEWQRTGGEEDLP
jgi:ATP-dependent helicase/nuclease subunit B